MEVSGEDATQHPVTEALMSLSRTMTAIVAHTLTDIAQEISVPQLRVLVLLSTYGPMNLRSLAEHLDVNPSNASRTCEQLVASGKVTREDDAEDRRTIRLTLTPAGAAFVDQLMHRRRGLLQQIVDQMDPQERDVLDDALRSFTAALARVPPEETVGLPDGRILPWLL